MMWWTARSLWLILRVRWRWELGLEAIKERGETTLASNQGILGKDSKLKQAKEGKEAKKQERKRKALVGRRRLNPI